MFRTVTRLLAVVLVCAAIVARFHPTAAQEDDVQALLDETASTMLALDSFHFVLETTAGKTEVAGAFELRKVEGDIVRSSSSFQATVNVNVAVVDLSLDVVGIGTDLWLRNPLTGGDSFVQVTGGETDISLPPSIFLNPDQLVLRALDYLENPEIAGTEDLDGEEMTVVTGTFDPSALISVSTPVPGIGELAAASEPLEVNAWIDNQHRLVRIDFIGPLFSFEEGTGRLVRRISFSNFDEPITIEQPA